MSSLHHELQLPMLGGAGEGIAEAVGGCLGYAPVP